MWHYMKRPKMSNWISDLARNDEKRKKLYWYAIF